MREKSGFYRSRLARLAALAGLIGAGAAGCSNSQDPASDAGTNGGAQSPGGGGSGGGGSSAGGSAGAPQGGTGASSGAGASAGVGAGAGSDGTGGAAGDGASGGAGGADAGVGGVAGFGANAGTGGACVAGCSCVGLGSVCQGESCCTSLPVSGSETLPLGPAGDERSATVDGFRLDKYEVTVGRFRRFVDAYDAWRQADNPRSGDGAHPAIPGSGWQTDMSSALPATAMALVSTSGVQCDATFQTWSADAPTNDSLPINCVNYYLAFAFCVWDDARLPTEVEWEYAAAGANENRTYPWGNAPVPDDVDGSRAVYNCLADGSAGGDCTFADILAVGSKSTGVGRFGQLDLAGSTWEWVLDWYASYPTTVGLNYAKVDTGSTRVYRGGSFSLDATNLPAASRFSRSQTSRSYGIGVRCARNP